MCEWAKSYWLCSFHPHKGQVVVDGKRLVLPAGMVVKSDRSSSWWCYQEILDGCEREVSERCARCAVKGEAPVAEIRMIPVPARGRGGHLLLPSSGCAKCHISGAGEIHVRSAP